MTPERRAELRALLATLDVVVLALAWWLAPAVRDLLVSAWPFDLVPGAEPVFRAVDPAAARDTGVLVVGSWAAALRVHGAWDAAVPRRVPWRRLGAAALTGGVGVVALLYLARLPHLSRTLLGGFAVATVPLLGAVRAGLRGGVTRWAAAGRQRIVWVAPAWALQAGRAALSGPDEAVPGVVVAWVCRDETDGVVSRVLAVLEDQPADEVRVTAGPGGLDELQDLASLCAELGLTFTVRWPETAGALGPQQVERTAPDTWALGFTPASGAGLRAALKRTLDLGLGALLVVASLPVLAVAAVAIRLEDGGPVWFVQERVGLRGRRFRMVKLRTMTPDAEARRPDLERFNETGGPAFKMRRDPRVTRVGAWLRRLSIDELPQLWHVLRGEMSLVGPRPALPREVARYTRAQRRRLSMRPGLTCTWQVSGRSDLDFRRQMALDLAYVDRWSLALDLWLLLRTVPAVLSGRGAR